jgi:hypothetical protein
MDFHRTANCVLTVCLTPGGRPNKVPIPAYEKTIQWVDIRVPKFPPLARQARILGTVAIEVRFKGCELDPASPHLVSGHPMLAPAAMESLKQSILRCGDFPDSNATVYYEFGNYERPGCESSGYPRVEVATNHVRVLATAPCVEE